MNNSFFIFAVILFSVCFIGSYSDSVLAQPSNAPKPPVSKRVDVLEKKLTSQKNVQKQSQSALKSLREKLVARGEAVQKIEKELADLEQEITELEAEYAEAEMTLSKDQKTMGNMVLAVRRLSTVPPHAMIAKPGAALQAAQTSLVLSDLLPRLKAQTDTIKETLNRFQVVKDSLTEKRSSVLARKKDAEQKNKELTLLVEKQKGVFRTSSRDLEKIERDLRSLSRQSKSLGELVKKVDRYEPALSPSSKPDKPQAAKQKVTSILSKGRARMPLSGVVLTGYNETDVIGARSKGITVQGRKNALIVAPMGGIIRFTGAFKNYGNMIIVEHKNDYHSLISGFKDIDVSVGQNVSAGQPLGRLKNNQGSKLPKLYFELRRNGKPLNPSKVIGGIG